MHARPRASRRGVNLRETVVNKYLRIGVSVLLLAIIAWRTNWPEVADQFARMRAEMCLAAAGLFLFAQIASARRWQLYARPLHFERPLSRFCAYYFIGMYFNLVLPSTVGGDVMRVVYLDGQSGRKWAAFLSVVLERINGLIVLTCVACLGLALTPIELPEWVAISVWGVAVFTVVSLASLPLLARWQRISGAKREQARTIVDLLCSPALMIEASFLSILTQLCGVFTVYFLGVGLGLDVPLGYYFVLSPMIVLLTMAPISVNGMGVREAGTVLFLTPFGVDVESALTLAFLWFAVGAAVSMFGGVVYLFTSQPVAKPLAA